MCLAVPGRIVSIEEGPNDLDRAGRINFGGVIKKANLSYVPEAGVGDYVIVHVGFAISRLNEEEANQTLEYLREINELNELKEREK